MVARTPFARIRGLGASGTGTREYWLVKLTSIALLPLTVYLAGVVVAVGNAGHDAISATLGKPYVAIPLFAFIVCNAIHMRLGMHSVIDDYVHTKTTKKIAVAANVFFSYGCAAAALYFIVMIGLRA